MNTLTPNQKREAVEKRVLQLFSGKIMSLRDLHDLAKSTIDMPGIESFHTRLPWEIRLADVRIILGDSEDLNSAAKDIFAQLKFLRDNGTEDAQVLLAIDETRLRQDPILGGV